MNETPATVRMIDGATAPVISNVFVNNACAVCTLQITGSFATATVLVEGIVNVASNQWVTLAAFNLSDLSLEKNGADKAGIYQVGIEGILRVRMNVTEVTGGDITIAAQFGNATINQFSKTEASNLIPITAYDLAVAGGYTGTLEQFETDMGNSGTNAANAAASASAAAASAESVSASAAQIATNTNDISDLKTQLKDENAAMLANVNGGNYSSAYWSDGAIYNHLTTNNSTFQRSGIIHLNIGDTISFTGGKGTTALPINAITQIVNGAYQSLKYYSGSSAEEITYTETLSERYVIVSTLKTLYDNDLTVIVNGSLPKTNETNIDKLNDKFNSLPDYIKQDIEPFNVISESNGASAYKFKQGETYYITNNIANALSLSTRETPSAVSIDTLVVQGNGSGSFMASADANYIAYDSAANFTIHTKYTLIPFIDKTSDALYPAEYTFSSSGNMQYNFVRGKSYRIDNKSAEVVRFATRTNPSGVSVDYVDIPNNSVYTLTASGNASYLVVNKACTFTITDADTLGAVAADCSNGIGHLGKYVPMVRFDFADDWMDFSDDLIGVDFTATSGGYYTIPDVVTAKFDDLVSANSGYMSKVDAGSDVGLTYPDYANLGGESSGNYDATPTYKTYMYKLIATNDSVYGSFNKKKKVLMIGATHGSESAGAFNLYLFAKNLCECANSDYFKLRSAFDFYIVPCLNGYGMYHSLRWNARGVNINRNYPIGNFAVSGEPFTKNYTGPTPASEFETQLIVALQNKYDFDIAIDHHNYGASKSQFYIESNYDRFRPLSNASLNDCSIAFIKNLPSYFGTKHKLFVHIANSTLPNAILSSDMPTMARWMWEQNLDFSATLEISNQINYINGVEINTDSPTKYNADTFSVGEFTLRNGMLYYGGFVLGAIV